MSGVWLTDEGEFFEFEAMLSRSEGVLLAIEQFENVTSTIPTTAHQPGTGASFGYLARQVLQEARGAQSYEAIQSEGSIKQEGSK